MSDRMRQLAVPLLALTFGLVALGVAAVVTLAPSTRQSTAGGIGGPFALLDQDGKTVTERDVRGRPHLVFFGFTHCPDVCPTKLFEISQVLQATGEKGRNLRALFITVDPERDTPEVLKSYLASFDERIIGLTGSREAVEAATRAFRAFARKGPGQDGSYAMEHTSLVYLMDAQGNFVGSFDLSRPPAEAAAQLLKHV